MSVLLLKFAPYIAGVLLVFSAGTYTGYRLNPWQARYHALQLTDAQQRADGEAAVRKALEEQLKQAQATSRNNADSMVQLANENAQIATDRDATVTRVRRLEQLLGASRRPAPSGGGLPQNAGGTEPPASSSSGSLTEIERLLVTAKEECERTANDYDALVTQVAPQVQP